MPTKFKRKLIMLPGASITAIALLLFLIGISGTMAFPPVSIMEYGIVIFTILGINFGISSGKKLAYTVHDRNIILERTKGQGIITSIMGNFMRLPVLFASSTFIIWSLFIIILSLSWSVLSDSVFIGEVRWLMIFSMALLITGSYIFYKARSSGKSNMLTLRGKIIMERSSSIMGGAMGMVDQIEDTGKDIVSRILKKL